MSIQRLYVIGSLRNPQIPNVANRLRELGYDVFDDWYSAGPEADDHWKAYEQQRGRSYVQALKGAAANNVFRFDKAHLDKADAVVMVLPAGKSAHLELGYVAGSGKPAFILMPPDECRWDVMYRFATGVVETTDELHDAITAL